MYNADPSKDKGKVPVADYIEDMGDLIAQDAVLRDLGKIEHGIGDKKQLGGGLYEVRVGVGGAHRVYGHNKNGEDIFVLAGHKRTQGKDIPKAREHVAELEHTLDNLDKVNGKPQLETNDRHNHGKGQQHGRGNNHHGRGNEPQIDPRAAAKATEALKGTLAGDPKQYGNSHEFAQAHFPAHGSSGKSPVPTTRAR